jgi:hypothetical protein
VVFLLRQARLKTPYFNWDGAMKSTILFTLLAGLLSSSPVHAAERTLTPQQQRMTTCNQQATSQDLKGDARKSYMSNCLKNSQSAPGDKSLTPQQQKMKSCNTEAGNKSLTGDARKTFMSECLKKAS